LGSAPRISPVSRPGTKFINPVDAISLFTAGVAESRASTAPKGAPPEVTLSIYVEITTPPIWDGDTVWMVDLDLDVVRTLDGQVLVVDEDEFGRNQVGYWYPQDMITSARTSCDEIAAASD